MLDKLLPFAGGILLGAVAGVFLVSAPALEVAVGMPIVFIVGVAVVTFVAGLLVGRKTSPKPEEVRMTGRVFEFPQGPLMVEVALKRMGSILPTKVVSSD